MPERTTPGHRGVHIPAISSISSTPVNTSRHMPRKAFEPMGQVPEWWHRRRVRGGLRPGTSQARPCLCHVYVTARAYAPQPLPARAPRRYPDTGRGPRGSGRRGRGRGNPFAVVGSSLSRGEGDE